MREAMAVTGFIPKDQASNYKEFEFLEVMPERDVESVVMRVATGDVEEARIGSTDKNGLTMVQLILRDETTIETVVRTSGTEPGLRAFNDPVLNRVCQEATIRVIMI
jgi:hypothetical protein